MRRKECQMTQVELARLAGIPQPNLSNIEKDKCDLTVTTLSRIAFALRAEPQDFFGPAKAWQGRKIILTRQRVESLAEMVVSGETPGDPKERFVVESIRTLLPQKKTRIPVRNLHEAWLRLHDVLKDEDIETILERIEDERLRQD